MFKVYEAVPAHHRDRELPEYFSPVGNLSPDVSVSESYPVSLVVFEDENVDLVNSEEPVALYTTPSGHLKVYEAVPGHRSDVESTDQLDFDDSPIWINYIESVVIVKPEHVQAPEVTEGYQSEPGFEPEVISAVVEDPDNSTVRK